MGKPIIALTAACVLAGMTVNAGGAQMKVSSSAFNDNGTIPARYTCKGQDVNPQLTVEGVPEKARSLALIVDDPDAPSGTYVHWVVYDIPVDSGVIRENSVPGIQGRNSSGGNDWGGPCPPSGTHRYFFKLYALDTTLALEPSSTDAQALEKAMQGHILASGRIMARFSH